MLDMRLRAGPFFASGLFAGLLMTMIAAEAEPQHPNILFLFADDQTFDSVSALGNDEIETPHLDQLARSGMVFTRAYNPGSWSPAVCIASRTMLNTGRFLWHAPRAGNQPEQERQAGRFWSESLKQAGYDTYMTGKWHVAANANAAFDFTAHIRGGMPRQSAEGYHRPPATGLDAWQPWDPRFGGYWEDGKHWSEIVADDTIAFLAQAAKRDKPFFMYVAFNAPHDPRQSPREYLEKYPLDILRVPDSYLPEYPFKDAMGCGKDLRDEQLAPFPRSEYAVRVHRQEYYAIITHLDAQIGRILAALRQSRHADNTLIVFTADHGLAVGQHGLMGKQNMFEHSMRVPLIIAGPNVPAGRKSAGCVYLQDIMPTTLEWAGTAIPEHVEFKSLLPIVRGERVGNYDSIYGAYLDRQRMVIRDEYKLILYPSSKTVLLFHLPDDPHEMRDLASNAQHRPVVKRLFAELLRQQAAMGDPLDLRSAYPEL
jgi:arylsulfatase A-like enzyme